MQLTKHTDLSLRVLMYLSINGESLATIKDISASYKVSRNHMMKVVNRLVTLGYIKSTQGRGGGISLAMPASDIGVGDIVRAMEPSLDLIDCAGDGCPLTPACLLKGALNEAMKAFVKSLDNYSVADLVRNSPQLIKLIG